MGRHHQPPARGKYIAALAIILACEAGGTALLIRGHGLAGQNWTYNSTPWTIGAVLVMMIPVLMALVAGALVICQLTAAELKRYGAWKQALPPSQRATVNTMEVIGGLGLAAGLLHYERRHGAEVAASAMGQHPLNDVHAGIMRTTAGLHSQLYE
jgi:hypothetical protein